MCAVEVAGTRDVVIVNVALVAPTGIVSVDGTWAAELSEASVTEKPVGAALLIVTVAVVE